MDCKNETWRCSVETDLVNKSWMNDYILFMCVLDCTPPPFFWNLGYTWSIWLEYPLKLWRYSKVWYKCRLISKQTEMSHFHFHPLFHVFYCLGSTLYPHHLVVSCSSVAGLMAQTEVLVPPAEHLHKPPNIYKTVIVGNTFIFHSSCPISGN